MELTERIVRLQRWYHFDVTHHTEVTKPIPYRAQYEWTSRHQRNITHIHEWCHVAEIETPVPSSDPQGVGYLHVRHIFPAEKYRHKTFGVESDDTDIWPIPERTSNNNRVPAHKDEAHPLVYHRFQ
jgi:hypothetical protein